ncbi:MAG: hypothetical protein AB8B53_13725 [Flavobacteriales bacterium]
MNKILLFLAAGLLSLASHSQNYFGLAPSTNTLYEIDLSEGFSGFTGVSLEYSGGTIAGYN